MTPMARLRAVLCDQVAELEQEVEDSDSEENYYQYGKIFALNSTIEKINEIDPTAKA